MKVELGRFKFPLLKRKQPEVPKPPVYDKYSKQERRQILQMLKHSDYVIGPVFNQGVVASLRMREVLQISLASAALFDYEKEEIGPITVFRRMIADKESGTSRQEAYTVVPTDEAEMRSLNINRNILDKMIDDPLRSLNIASFLDRLASSK